MIFRRALIAFVLGIWSALLLLAAVVVLAGSAHATEPHPAPPAPPPAQSRSCQWSADSFHGSDKAQHFMFSLIFAAGATAGTKDAGAGFVLGMVPGVLKEYRDYRTGAGTCSGKDMVMNIAGAATGALLVRGLVLVPERNGLKVAYYTTF